MPELAFRSLMHRLALVVALLLGVFAVGSVALVSKLAYDEEHARAAEQFRSLLYGVRAQAAVAVFSGDIHMTQELLGELLLSPGIAKTEIHVGEREWYRVKPDTVPDEDNAQAMELVSPVDYVSPVGVIEVYPDRNYLFGRLQTTMIRVGVMAVALLVMTAVLLMTSFHYIVGRPLVSFARQVEGLEPGSGARLPLLPRHENDEIGSLTHATNRLLSATDAAIDEEKHLRREISRLDAHYQRVFHNTSVGIAVLDHNGRVIDGNRALETQFLGNGLSIAVLRTSRRSLFPVLFAEPRAVWQLVDQSRQAGVACSADLALLGDVGADEARWVTAVLSVTESTVAGEQQSSIECLLYDITERHQKEQASRYLALTDKLTALQNRHSCEEMIDQALRRSYDSGQPFGILLIDLDGFKAVNDTYGHAAGDVVLVEAAQRFSRCVRRGTDHVFRLGGDEFVVLIQHGWVNDLQLGRIGWNLIEALEEPVMLDTEGVTAQIGASIGVARYPVDGDNRVMLLEQADHAMYQAKHGGKNLVAFANAVTSDAAYGKLRSAVRRTVGGAPDAGARDPAAPSTAEMDADTARVD